MDKEKVGKLMLHGFAFTLVGWLAGALAAALAAYVYARIRGDLLPHGGFGVGGPRSLWVGLNFRAFLPPFLAVGSVLGVVVGQVQFWAWTKIQDRN